VSEQTESPPPSAMRVVWPIVGIVGVGVIAGVVAIVLAAHGTDSAPGSPAPPTEVVTAP